MPDGVSATDLSRYVFVDVFDPEGRGNWGQPDGDGKFEIPLQPGEYELTIWVDPELLRKPKPRSFVLEKTILRFQIQSHLFPAIKP